MASVHPSRLGLVPGARAALGHPSRAPAPTPGPAAPSFASSPRDREEELRRQLLERRRQGSARHPPGGDSERIGRQSDAGPSWRASGDDAGAGPSGGGPRGARELLPDQTDTSGRLSRSPRSPPLDERRRSPSLSRRYRAVDRSPGGRDERDNGHRPAQYESEGRSRIGYEETGEAGRRRSLSYRPYRPVDPAQSGSTSPRRNGHGAADYGYGRRDDVNGSGYMRPPLRFELNGIGTGNGNDHGNGRGWQNPPPHRGFLTQADFERRRLEREKSTLSIWPKSPERPYRDDEQLKAERKARRKAKKSSRRRRRYSDETSSSEEEDAEEERRRRRRRRERERQREHSDEDDDRGERRGKRRRERDRDNGQEDGRRAKGDARSRHADAEWVEVDDRRKSASRSRAGTSDVGTPVEDAEEDELGGIGPQLPHEAPDRYRRAAYSNMLKGEAEAMARFAATGQRIPRRGEIGLDTSKIEAFEESGYVMSGSRHRRMNAVRLRKENQVINDQEKRALLRLQREENERKEGAIISQFREVISERLAKIEGKKAQEGLDEAGEQRDKRAR